MNNEEEEMSEYGVADFEHTMDYVLQPKETVLYKNFNFTKEHRAKVLENRLKSFVEDDKEEQEKSWKMLMDTVASADELNRWERFYPRMHKKRAEDAVDNLEEGGKLDYTIPLEDSLLRVFYKDGSAGASIYHRDPEHLLTRIRALDRYLEVFKDFFDRQKGKLARCGLALLEIDLRDMAEVEEESYSFDYYFLKSPEELMESNPQENVTVRPIDEKIKESWRDAGIDPEEVLNYHKEDRA